MRSSNKPQAVCTDGCRACAKTVQHDHVNHNQAHEHDEQTPHEGACACCHGEHAGHDHDGQAAHGHANGGISCGCHDEHACDATACGCHDEHAAHSHAKDACDGGISCGCHDEDDARSPLLRVLLLAAALLLLLAGALLPVSVAVRYALHLTGWALCGYDVVLRAAKNVLRGAIFDENMLMLLATVGAFVLGETAEAVGVMLFYQVGETLQDRAIDSSQRAIAGLIDTRPEYAVLLKDGAEHRVAAADLRRGDIVVVRPGERLPADGTLMSGGSSIDTSALTGESTPRDVTVGDAALAGGINLNGQITLRVDKESGESAVARVLQLVRESTAHKAKTETFITRFAKIYTPAVVGIAALIALTPLWLAGATWHDWTYRGLLFLVVSCPCALVLSVPLGYFVGIGRASKRGVLIKGGQYLDALAQARAIAFDKTGTLTLGTLRLADIHAEPGAHADEVLRLAALAESASTHPVALAVRRAYQGDLPVGLVIEETPGMGMAFNDVRVGNDRLMREAGITALHGSDGESWVHVARGGVYLGALRLVDELKPGAAQSLDGLRQLGVSRMVMLSGDTQAAAQAVAEPLNLEARAGLLPDGKVRELRQIMAEGKGATLFVGDGINDAPVLRVADAGIAMGALGSDAALEAADIVLMDDSLDSLPEAIRIARKTRRVIISNIAFALGVKLIVLVLGALGLASMWAAIVADVGAALVCVANSALGVRLKRRS